jgi:hypothetical protein
MSSSGYLADKIPAMDFLNKKLGPTFYKVEDHLRDEMAIKHPWYLRPFERQSRHGDTERLQILE